jgi:hypothetical protein
MATTTNYAWETPDDTDLVKDGAAAIRTLGSSIDTTTKALNPSTTLGDIEYRSSTANTNTRLGIGSNGQYLTITGGVPAWGAISAGGMTLLSTTTLSGASVTISSIDQTYTNLQIFIYGVTNATGNGTFRCAPNANTGITNFQKTSTLGSVDGSVNDYLMLAEGNVSSFTNNNNVYSVTIENYSSTASRKSYRLSGGYIRTDGSTPQPLLGAGWINTTSAISSLVFTNTGGNLSTGTVLIYGVK